jgi:hypothetical protein
MVKRKRSDGQTTIYNWRTDNVMVKSKRSDWQTTIYNWSNCRSLFVRLSFFFWPLHCLSFNCRSLFVRLLFFFWPLHCLSFNCRSLFQLKDRQCNGQKKKGRRTNNNLQLKDRQCNGQKKKVRQTNNDLQKHNTENYRSNNTNPNENQGWTQVWCQNKITNDYIHYTKDLSLIILRLWYFVENMSQAHGAWISFPILEFVFISNKLHK